MAERYDCDACVSHDRPCHGGRCPCACTPRNGRDCGAAVGGVCDCFPAPKKTEYAAA